MKKIGRLRNALNALMGKDGSGFYVDCDEDVNDYISNPFTNPSFAIAMNKRVEATKAVKIGIFTGVDDKKKEITDHLLNPLCENLNSNLTWGEFVEYILNWSLGTDNGCLIRKVTGLTFMSPDIVVYSPHNFNVECGTNGIRKITIINPGMTFEGEELKNFVWIKSPNFQDLIANLNPGMTKRGFSLQNAMGTIGAYIRAVWLWNWRISKNSGRATGIITGDRIREADVEEIKDTVSSQVTSHNNGGILVLGGNAKYIDTSKNPTDADWLKGEKIAHERICLSLGVPPELCGGGESTYNNRKEARAELYVNTIIPWAQDIMRKLNNLLKNELKGAYFDIKTSHIEALKKDKSVELKSLESTKDRLTVNEYRKIAGGIFGVQLKDVPNGDEIIIGSDTLKTLVEPIGGDGGESEEDI